MTARAAPRRFVESQLQPVVQAFGFSGGWSVERRPGAKKKGKLAERQALAAEIQPWPCAGPRCTKLIRLEPEKARGRFRKYCSDSCRRRTANRRYQRRQGEQDLVAWRARQAAARERYKAKLHRNPELYEQARGREREWCRVWRRSAKGQARKESRRQRQREAYHRLTPEQKAGHAARHREWYRRRTPETIARQRAYRQGYMRLWRLRRRTPEQSASGRSEAELGKGGGKWTT